MFWAVPSDITRVRGRERLRRMADAHHGCRADLPVLSQTLRGRNKANFGEDKIIPCHVAQTHCPSRSSSSPRLRWAPAPSPSRPRTTTVRRRRPWSALALAEFVESISSKKLNRTIAPHQHPFRRRPLSSRMLLGVSRASACTRVRMPALLAGDWLVNDCTCRCRHGCPEGSD